MQAFTKPTNFLTNLGRCHGHEDVLPVKHKRADNAHWDRHEAAHDLAVRAEDALVVVTLSSQDFNRTVQKVIRAVDTQTRGHTSALVHNKHYVKGKVFFLTV